jgi:hypothetical protein
MAFPNLANILPQWSSIPVPINAIYSSHKYMPQKVKVFLDFLGNAMNANSIDVAPSFIHFLYLSAVNNFHPKPISG